MPLSSTKLIPLLAAARVKTKYWLSAPALDRHIQECRGVPSRNWGKCRIFSQNGEDGALAAIIDRIGIGPRKFVEFGFGAMQNNSLAFALKHKASGVCIDCSERMVRIGQEMFAILGRSDIKVLHAWLDRSNIDALVSSGASEIDLLSIDVDGNDYWFWKEITSLHPRIVIVEYNASFGRELAVTVPYDPAFNRHEKHASGIYHGMSLRAASELGQSKGYALIGCEAAGVNAFFVRRELLGNGLQELPPEECYRPHQNRIERGLTQEAQEEIVYSLPVVRV